MQVGYICSVLFVSLLFVQVDSVDRTISISRFFTRTGGAESTRDLAGCECVKFNCGCCAHIVVEKIGLNDTACVNITYLPKQAGISVTASFNGVIYFNETLSVNNPPSYCYPVPYMEELAHLCFQTYNLKINHHVLMGCVRIQVQFEGLILGNFKLGCFKIPPLGIKPATTLNLKEKKKIDFGTAVYTKSGLKRCGCVKYNCGCCAHLEVEKVGLNDTVCANISYLPDQYGVSLTVSVDGVVYFNRTVSVKNPPPFCFGVPYLKKLASLCVQLYDLDIKNHTLTGCASLVVVFESIKVESFKLGCFKIPPHGAKPDTILKFKKKTKMDFENMDWNEFSNLIDYFNE